MVESLVAKVRINSQIEVAPRSARAMLFNPVVCYYPPAAELSDSSSGCSTTSQGTRKRSKWGPVSPPPALPAQERSKWGKPVDLEQIFPAPKPQAAKSTAVAIPVRFNAKPRLSMHKKSEKMAVEQRKLAESNKETIKKLAVKSYSKQTVDERKELRDARRARALALHRLGSRVLSNL